jgi:uncharacterized protein YyaL (SSP411 family)
MDHPADANRLAHEKSPFTALAPFTSGMKPVDGRAAAYVCEGNSCGPSLTDPGELETLLASPP